MAKMRKVSVVRGYGAFVGANHVEVEETSGTAQESVASVQANVSEAKFKSRSDGHNHKTGSKKVFTFKHAIIAADNQAMRLPFMPMDPRVVDSTGALALKEVPKRMLMLGRLRPRHRQWARRRCHQTAV
jgi:dihydrolipoamide dehydrogenase